jgi:hypothetical protein
MRNANTIPKMPYENAKSICAMEGGRIAQMRDGYGGQFLLMTLIKSIKEYSKELPPKGKEYDNGDGCSAPNRYSIDTQNL